MKFKALHISIILTLVLITLIQFITFAQPPAGYYNNADGLKGQPLQLALYSIIKDHTARSYANLWTDFQSTDKKDNGKVWDMYSDVPDGTPAYEFTFVTNQCGNYGGEGDCYNREHSWPKSWFNDATPMYTELFHIVPTDGYVNGKRSNYPYGEVGIATWISTNGSKVGPCSFPGYVGIVFEPIDDYKGDFARGYFYMATRYQNVIAGWETNDPNGNAVMNGTSYPAFEAWTVNLLLAWHNADPVSAKEIARNNAVFAIQHNRNPYIDHPEYAVMVWDPNVGIESTADKTAHILVWPMPISSQLNFTLENYHPTGELNLKILDVTGRVVIEKQMVSNQTITLNDLDKLITGFYMLCVSENGRTIATTKLLKN